MATTTRAIIMLLATVALISAAVPRPKPSDAKPVKPAVPTQQGSEPGEVLKGESSYGLGYGYGGYSGYGGYGGYGGLHSYGYGGYGYPSYGYGYAGYPYHGSGYSGLYGGYWW